MTTFFAPASTVASSVPSTESCLSRCAIVFVSPRAFAETTSKSPPCTSWARRKLRPIRPKPLIPTLIFAMSQEAFLVAVFSRITLEKRRRRARPVRARPDHVRRQQARAARIPEQERGAKRSGARDNTEPPRPTCAGARSTTFALSRRAQRASPSRKAERSGAVRGKTQNRRARPVRARPDHVRPQKARAARIPEQESGAKRSGARDNTERRARR